MGKRQSIANRLNKLMDETTVSLTLPEDPSVGIICIVNEANEIQYILDDLKRFSEKCNIKSYLNDGIYEEIVKVDMNEITYRVEKRDEPSVDELFNLTFTMGFLLSRNSGNNYKHMEQCAKEDVFVLNLASKDKYVFSLETHTEVTDMLCVLVQRLKFKEKYN